MLRWNKIVIAALFSLLPLTTYADTTAVVGGGFAFLHLPVNPEQPDGFCAYPPGLFFRVASESFDGLLVTEKGAYPFIGTGNAAGCAFLQPLEGVAAIFVGSATWQTTDGELRGTFALLDFPTEHEGVFDVVIFITFDGGTGVFKKARGEAIAEGSDFPFGGLGGDPTAAGVVAQFIEGELKLKK